MSDIDDEDYETAGRVLIETFEVDDDDDTPTTKIDSWPEEEQLLEEEQMFEEEMVEEDILLPVELEQEEDLPEEPEFVVVKKKKKKKSHAPKIHERRECPVTVITCNLVAPLFRITEEGIFEMIEEGADDSWERQRFDDFSFQDEDEMGMQDLGSYSDEEGAIERSILFGENDDEEEPFDEEVVPSELVQQPLTDISCNLKPPKKHSHKKKKRKKLVEKEVLLPGEGSESESDDDLNTLDSTTGGSVNENKEPPRRGYEIKSRHKRGHRKSRNWFEKKILGKTEQLVEHRKPPKTDIKVELDAPEVSEPGMRKAPARPSKLRSMSMAFIRPRSDQIPRHRILPDDDRFESISSPKMKQSSKLSGDDEHKFPAGGIKRRMSFAFRPQLRDPAQLRIRNKLPPKTDIHCNLVAPIVNEPKNETTLAPKMAFPKRVVPAKSAGSGLNFPAPRRSSFNAPHPMLATLQPNSSILQPQEETGSRNRRNISDLDDMDKSKTLPNAFVPNKRQQLVSESVPSLIEPLEVRDDEMNWSDSDENEKRKRPTTDIQCKLHPPKRFTLPEGLSSRAISLDGDVNVGGKISQSQSEKAPKKANKKHIDEFKVPPSTDIKCDLKPPHVKEKKERKPSFEYNDNFNASNYKVPEMPKFVRKRAESMAQNPTFARSSGSKSSLVGNAQPAEILASESKNSRLKPKIDSKAPLSSDSPQSDEKHHHKHNKGGKYASVNDDSLFAAAGGSSSSSVIADPQGSLSASKSGQSYIFDDFPVASQNVGRSPSENSVSHKRRRSQHDVDRKGSKPKTSAEVDLEPPAPKKSKNVGSAHGNV